MADAVLRPGCDAVAGVAGWVPGQTVGSEADHVAWLNWRADRRRQQQRDRRRRYCRIDYYPDDFAATLIYSMVERRAGGDLSSVISKVIADWARITGCLPPE